jgi:hypothetical protein
VKLVFANKFSVKIHLYDDHLAIFNQNEENTS